jgi:hypothetical protein
MPNTLIATAMGLGVRAMPRSIGVTDCNSAWLTRRSGVEKRRCRSAKKIRGICLGQTGDKSHVSNSHSLRRQSLRQ